MIKIIAEAGIAHNGSLKEALNLVAAAADAGANAVKFQLYHTSKLVRKIPNRPLLALCELTPDDHWGIAQYCKSKNIEWMASCFDKEAVDLACKLGASTIKLGSGEITNLELIKYIAGTRKHLILSTGASTIDDIFHATMEYDTWIMPARMGYERLTLMHCVSLYPTPLELCNLKSITTLKHNFRCPVGWSDHSVGFDSAVAAVALGVDVIEKHLMLEPGCADEAVSLTPENFAGYVATIRRAEQMMGNGEKVLQPGEAEMQKHIRGRWNAIQADSAAGYQESESSSRDTHGGAPYHGGSI